MNKNRNYVLMTQVVNTIIALITGKLIAIFISPEDFGAYSIQWAAFIFFSTLLIMPIIQFIKTTEKTLIPKIGVKYYLRTTIGIIIVAFVMLILFLNFYYKNLNISLFAILLLFLPFYSLSTIIANYLNIENKLIDFSYQSILKSSGGLIFLALYFFLGFTFLKPTEVLWSIQLIGVVLVSLFFISKYRFLQTKFKIAYVTFLKKYFRFAGPLMFMAIWAWINNYFDRYAIEYYLSLKEVGVYNANYSIGSKFFLMISPIFMILVTPFVFSGIPKKNKKQILFKYGIYYSLLALPILIIIYFLKNFIGEVLLSKNYQEGFFIIFWIALSFFIFTLTQLFELYFYAEQNTKLILLGNLLAAIINISLNILLIPKMGIEGAALATLFGFVAYLGIIYVNMRRLT